MKTFSITLTRADALKAAHALNREASRLDDLLTPRKATRPVPDQTRLVWAQSAARNRELSRRIVEQLTPAR